MRKGALLYQWLLNRIRWLAGVVSLYGTMCALFAILLSIAVLLVVSLIPLYLNRSAEEALGERYCINNYSLIIGFEIPQYNTTFTDTMTTTANYAFSGGQVLISPNAVSCTGPINITTSESVSVKDVCGYVLYSIIYPATPNAHVFNSYALSEACYRTLQTCNYDPLLTSCLLSDCVVVSVVTPSVAAAYPLTYYRVRCTANIYYKIRCLDSPASYRLYYSSSQQNSACRQQRLDRINTCLNSTVELSNVPCLIGVSSGKITSAVSTCIQTVTANSLTINFIETGASSPAFGINPGGSPSQLMTTITATVFTASDQTDGHAYRILSVNSETYLFNQTGALYCGAVTHTQIASSITTAINSQSSK